MASRFSRYLRSDGAELQLADALRPPATRLLGMSETSGAALESIGIFTIFDLGAASIFTTARAAGPPTARESLPPGSAWSPATG